MNKKRFILVSKEDTVIRFVIAICHDPHEELLFLSVSQNALLSFPVILTPEKLCLLFSTFPSFL